MPWKLLIALCCPVGAFVALELLKEWFYRAEEYAQDEWEEVLKLNEGPWSDD